MDKLMTVDDVARKLQVHKQSVYRWMYAGKLEHTKVGRAVRFTESQVRRFLAQGGQ